MVNRKGCKWQYIMRLGVKSVKTVLILDADVGFVFWCGRLLTAAGYRAMAAVSVPEAITLTAELNLELDLLIVSPTISGAPGFVDRLRQTQKHVSVLAAIQSLAELEGRFLEVEAIKVKPTVGGEDEEFRWRTAVQLLLSSAPT
jgi:hypothetical protein